MLIEDKIKHSIIKACELDQEKEEPRYILPHLYTAAKLMHQHGQDMQIEEALFLRIHSQFKKIHEENRQLHLMLDQVHIFMDEEIQHILQTQSQWRSTPPKINSIHASRRQGSTLSEGELTLICIPQETYFFGSSCQSQAHQAEINQSPSLRRQPSLEAVPSFLHKQYQCAQRLQRVDKLYREHRLDQAYQESLQCKKKIYLSDPNLQVPREAVQMLKRIQQEYQMMTYFYQFFNEPGYIFDKQRDNVAMHYKLYEESKEVSVRVQAEIDISIQNFLCIVSEIDLFQEYIPFSYDTKELRSLSRNQKIGQSKVYLPLLSDRIAYFYAAAYDRLTTHNSIFFFSKTITSDQEFQKKIGFQIQKDPNYVELEYKFYIMEYIPIGPNRGKIRLGTNINLRLGFLPFFIINKTCRIFAFDFFQHLVEVNNNFKGSKWQKKMQKNQDTYNFFKHRILQYLKEGSQINK